MKARNLFHISVLAMAMGLAVGCSSPSEPAPDPDASAGRAISMDGQENSIAVENSRVAYDFIHSDGVFTIEAWIKLDNPDHARFQGIVGNTHTQRDYGFFFGFENRGGQQALRISINAGRNVIDAYSDAQLITDSQWHHVAVTGDGEEITFFLDGQEHNEVDGMSGFGTAASTRDLRIGDIHSRTVGEWQFDGLLDEVRVWSVERDAAQIQDQYRKTLGSEFTGSSDRGLAGYWRFSDLEDLGRGTDGANDIRDHSANDNHAEITNGGSLVQSNAY